MPVKSNLGCFACFHILDLGCVLLDFVAAKGVVCERSSKNSEIPTGDIEVVVSDMRVLSKAQTPPFEIVDDTNTNEELRLKYRYLDLRRRPLLNNLMMRSKFAKVARDYFHDNGFVEIETPYQSV